MKTLISILICFLFIAPNVIAADCSKPDGITLGAKRDIIEKELTKRFGVYSERDKDTTKWNITKGHYVACIFYNNTFYGFLTMLLERASNENGKKLVKIFHAFETVIEEDGFVFEKESYKDDGSIQTVSKEFFCPQNPRIKVIISLSKDFNKKIYGVEAFHFLSND